MKIPIFDLEERNEYSKKFNEDIIKLKNSMTNISLSHEMSYEFFQNILSKICCIEDNINTHVENFNELVEILK